MEKTSTKNLMKISLLAAILSLVAPFSIPIGPVPLSLTNFVLYLGIFAVGWKKALVSYLIYLIIGFIGLPVFSGFQGGPGKLFGPTGGYLFGFIWICGVSGYFIDKTYKNKGKTILAMVLGTVICYLFGTYWLKVQTNMGWLAAFMAGVLPFIPGDFLKIVAASFIGVKIRDALIRNGLFD